MCGICGFVGLLSQESITKDGVSAMNDVMSYRGPDDAGVYCGGAVGNGRYTVGLGHRRLSIIDLSAQGRQPMSNEDGSIWIVYNGEIYNFMELKDYLVSKGHVFRSNTDTEVIIHMYEEKGESCVEYFRGMFAFALWDGRKKMLFCSRDRLGIKPFYYYVDNEKLIFASEVKSILKSGKVNTRTNDKVINAYFTFGYVPAPHTMFEGIYKLLPGHSLTCVNGKVEVREYWDISKIEIGSDRGEKYYIGRFRELLDECVKMRLVSDVPLGVFLSGGIDSSTVVGIMNKFSGEGRVKTFCVGYKDKQASELEYARIVANKFNTDHHEYCLEPTDFYSFIPKLVWHFDEPVVEAAAIPFFFISKLAHEHVTVLLSGEGADELFGGYPIYKYMRMIERYRRIPGIIRSGLTDPVFGFLAGKGSKKKSGKYIAWSKLPLEQRYFGVSTELTEGFKANLYSDEFLRDESRHLSLVDLVAPYYSKVAQKDFLSKMLYLDTKVWLPDDLLIKADKMSMATSVELRVPFLDYKMVEFAASVPSKYKVNGWTTKYLLKKSVEDLLPRQIIHRRKRGFPVPITAWFKGDFSEKASQVLLDAQSHSKRYFNVPALEKIISDHKTGQDDHSRLLFSLIVFEMWHSVFIDRKFDFV
jgi:asparagine synthase (glutamine-hydrolysing)